MFLMDKWRMISKILTKRSSYSLKKKAKFRNIEKFQMVDPLSSNLEEEGLV